MDKTTRTVYGFGGYDPSKPNDNIIEIVEIEIDEEGVTHEDTVFVDLDSPDTDVAKGLGEWAN